MTPSLREERLLARGGFGPRPGDREELARIGAAAWLERQLAAGSDTALEARLAAFPARGFDPVAFLDGRELPRARENDARARELRMELRRRVRDVARELAGVRLVRAVHGQHGLYEVMVDFWANHFNVFARKGLVGALVPSYQRDVLERHALGRFEDLLVAVAKSPAMLVYLDNWTSVAPRPLARRFLKRGAGINENYARELLELHTLGVHGGYTQDDVVAVARVFTGWTLESRRRPVYRFRRALHDAEPKRVLDQRVRGSGEEEGRAVLARLARHPSTARHLATKLVQRFVADDPPGGLVERAAATFLSTGGEIRPVLRVILEAPEFADPARPKLKTPLRFLASALRESGGETDGRGPALAALARMGELPGFCRAPTGYPEAAEHWIDPGALLERMGVAFALARGRGRGTALGSALPGGSAETAALALAAPDFQWT